MHIILEKFSVSINLKLTQKVNTMVDINAYILPLQLFKRE